MKSKFLFRDPFLAPLALGLSLGIPIALQAQTLYSENFDDSNGASRWTPRLSGSDGVADFDFDYATIGLPSAPNSAGGSTRGMRFLVNQSAGVFQGISATPNSQSFPATGSFTVKFDMWLNYVGGAPAGGSGTTQLATMGWGTNGNSAQWPGSSGSIWFGSTLDGNSAQDYRVYRNNAHLTQGSADVTYAAASQNNNVSFYTNNFPGQSAPAAQMELFPGQTGTAYNGCLAFKWYPVEIEKLGSKVTWRVNGVEIASTNVTGATLGGDNIFFGLSDTNSGSSTDANDQLITAIYDNIIVEQLSSPDWEVISGSTVVTYTGVAPTSGTVVIKNLSATTPLQVQSLAVSGASAAAFTLDAAALPLNIDPATDLPVTVNFNPIGLTDGVKTATLTVETNDPVQPSRTFTLSGRRSVGIGLEAHLKLNESSGTTILNAVAGRPNSTLTVRAVDPPGPPEYGLASLNDPADLSNTSLKLKPANSSSIGSYINGEVVHTPSFSISLWVKPEFVDGDSANRCIFQRDGNFNGTLDEQYALLLNAGQLTLRINSGEACATDPLLIPDDEVSHIVVTHLDEDGFGNTTATRSAIYVNGRLKATATAGRGFEEYASTAFRTIYIGTRSTAGNGYRGGMDDIQCYSTELSPEQVWDLFSRKNITALQTPAFTGGNPGFMGGKFLVPAAPTSPDAYYQLQRSTNLNSWLDLGMPATGSDMGTTTNFEDPAPPAGASYYRVKKVPPPSDG